MCVCVEEGWEELSEGERREGGREGGREILSPSTILHCNTVCSVTNKNSFLMAIIRSHDYISSLNDYISRHNWGNEYLPHTQTLPSSSQHDYSNPQHACLITG